MFAMPMERDPPAKTSFPNFPMKSIEMADFPYISRPVMIIGKAMVQSSLISATT
jgi:hypothetical protein